MVIRQPEATELPARKAGANAHLLLLSAHSRPALNAAARAYADVIEVAGGVGDLATAVAWQRDLSAHRLALPIGDVARQVTALRHFAETGTIADGVVGVAPSTPPRVCFVFSGNGCQWAGMGRTAFAHNEAFRQQFQAIDQIFLPLAGWSLIDALNDPDLGERLTLTRVAQPLLYAVQSALAASLAAWGIRPDMALGHSVGEVAAAEVSGAIGLAEAVHIIFHRSEHQEGVHGQGTMAAANLPSDEAAALIADCGYPGLEIAAVNSPSSVTISGPEEAIRAFSQVARKRRIAVRVLNLAYPFHSEILEPLHQPLLASLGKFATRASAIPFISTVTGTAFDGRLLDGEYWWRNVRETVRFRDAVVTAAQQGAGPVYRNRAAPNSDHQYQ